MSTVPALHFGRGSCLVFGALGVWTMWVLPVVFAVPALILLTRLRIVEPDS